MKYVGLWNDGKYCGSDFQMVEIDGVIYALNHNHWNGEEYQYCWECIDAWTPAKDKKEYTLKPVYKFEVENIDFEILEENSDEWNDAVEIVDYKVYEINN